LNYWKVSLVGLAAAVLAFASCGHPSGGGSGTGGSTGTGGSGSCQAGALGCPCNNGNCDQGVCATDINTCVTVGGTGGTPATGGTPGTGGAVSTGGTPATGGTPGTGGTPATGGTPGTGGTPATGGTPGTGGTPATGGTPGTGGTPATGGSPGTGGSTSGGNLITNGDFSNGSTNWGIPNGGTSSSGVNNGAFCVTTSGTGSVIVGWGDSSTSFNLMANVGYTLSYQASASMNLSSFEVHIGQVISPYNVDHQENNDKPGNSLQTFTHNFTVTSGDPQTGLAFVFAGPTGTNVCFDNVSLTQN
jgi:hypothetical protein